MPREKYQAINDTIRLYQVKKNDSWQWFDFSVVDDNGHIYDKLKLQAGMAGNYGHHMVLTLPPMDTIPKSFTLKPSHTNSEGN